MSIENRKITAIVQGVFICTFSYIIVHLFLFRLVFSLFLAKFIVSSRCYVLYVCVFRLVVVSLVVTVSVQSTKDLPSSGTLTAVSELVMCTSCALGSLPLMDAHPATSDSNSTK